MFLAGPAKAFGISPLSFARESCFSQLSSATQVIARSQALHYLHGQRRAIRDSHVVFSFRTSGASEGSPSKAKSQTSIGLASIAAELRLIHRVCVQTGISDRSPHDLARYFTGDDPRFLELYPELGDFRDIMLFFRLVTAPSADQLPKVARWTASSSRLEWLFKTSKAHSKASNYTVPAQLPAFVEPGAGGAMKRIQEEDPSSEEEQSPRSRTRSAAEQDIATAITTFGNQHTDLDGGDAQLDLSGGKIQVMAFGQKISFAWSAGDWYDPSVSMAEMAMDGGKGRSKRKSQNFNPRAPVVLSGGEPSALVGQPVSSEEDILRIKELPSFGGYLDAHSSELLCQFVTVPYMRIPLILHFFAAESDGSGSTCRINALCNEKLQTVLEACVFEPHHWRAFSPTSEVRRSCSHLIGANEWANKCHYFRF